MISGNERDLCIFDCRAKQSDILPAVLSGESTSLRVLFQALVDADYSPLRIDSVFQSRET